MKLAGSACALSSPRGLYGDSSASICNWAVDVRNDYSGPRTKGCEFCNRTKKGLKTEFLIRSRQQMRNIND